MKIKKKANKKSWFKKIFIKICRLLDYEIIDQGNFYLPVTDQDLNQDLSVAGQKSLTIPMGKLEITRKVKSLTIILRTCASVNMLQQSKKRLFNQEKSEYTLRSLNSITRSINYAKDLFKNINLELIIVDHNSDQNVKDKIQSIISNQSFKSQFINLNIDDFKKNINPLNEQKKNVTTNQISNMSNIHQSLLIGKKSEDLVYFVEDDYIHKINAIGEMLLSYERISSQLGKELIMCPADYPYLYNKLQNSKIILGNSCHWRSIDESLCTFLTSKKVIKKHFRKFISACEYEHYPFEKPFHDVYKKELCISPMPALAIHFTNINSIYGLSPLINYEKLWKENKL